MMRKILIVAALAGTVVAASPAFAGGWGGWNDGRGKPGHSSSGGHSTSGGHSSTSSGATPVPEPGMLGLLGAGLLGLAYARRRAVKRG